LVVPIRLYGTETKEDHTFCIFSVKIISMTYHHVTNTIISQSNEMVFPFSGSYRSRSWPQKNWVGRV